MILNWEKGLVIYWWQYLQIKIATLKNFGKTSVVFKQGVWECCTEKDFFKLVHANSKNVKYVAVLFTVSEIRFFKVYYWDNELQSSPIFDRILGSLGNGSVREFGACGFGGCGRWTVLGSGLRKIIIKLLSDIYKWSYPNDSWH